MQFHCYIHGGRKTKAQVYSITSKVDNEFTEARKQPSNVARQKYEKDNVTASKVESVVRTHVRRKE